MADNNERPTLQASVVEEYKNKEGKDDTYWTEVGVAFPHKDGPGYNLVIRTGLSVSGKIVLTAKKPRTDDSGAGFPE